MTKPNDNYGNDLNQIRERQQAVVDEIEKLRERSGGIMPIEIEQIRSDALEILDELDEIRKQHDGELQSRATRSHGATGTGVFFSPDATRPQSVEHRA